MDDSKLQATFQNQVAFNLVLPPIQQPTLPSSFTTCLLSPPLTDSNAFHSSILISPTLTTRSSQHSVHLTSCSCVSTSTTLTSPLVPYLLPKCSSCSHFPSILHYSSFSSSSSSSSCSSSSSTMGPSETYSSLTKAPSQPPRTTPYEKSLSHPTCSVPMSYLSSSKQQEHYNSSLSSFSKTKILLTPTTPSQSSTPHIDASTNTTTSSSSISTLPTTFIPTSPISPLSSSSSFSSSSFFTSTTSSSFCPSPSNSLPSLLPQQQQQQHISTCTTSSPSNSSNFTSSSTESFNALPLTRLNNIDAFTTSFLSIQVSTSIFSSPSFSFFTPHFNPSVQTYPLPISTDLKNLFEWEAMHQLSSHQLAMYQYHPSLTRLRRNIIFWLYELNRRQPKFHYSLDVLFLAIQFLDRFLSPSSHSSLMVSQGHMYLLGMVCFSLAAKMRSEYDDPMMQDMVYQLSPWKFQSKDILAFQFMVLKHLKYDLNGFTPLDYLHEFLKQPNVQILLASSLNQPCFIETVHERWHGSLSFSMVESIFKIAERYLALSLYATPGTLPSAIALSCLNYALQIHSQEHGGCTPCISILPHPSFLHSRMVHHHTQWIQEFVSQTKKSTFFSTPSSNATSAQVNAVQANGNT